VHIAVLSDPANFHTQKWSLALQGAGAEVTIFSFSDYEYDQVPCVKIQPRYTVKGRVTYASYLYSADRLHKALLKHRVDIVNPINITPFGVWAARTGFRPMASIAMGADVLEYPPNRAETGIPYERSWSSVEDPGLLKQAVSSFKWYVFRHQVQDALNKSDFIIGDNLQLVQAVKEWFGIPAHKVSLNRWGIEEELFETSEARLNALREKFGIRPWQKVVLAPRGVKPVYQGDIVLQAYERLLRRGVRDLKLMLFSAGYDIPEKLDKRARALEAHFPNFYLERSQLPRTEVLELWSLVDVCISAPVYDGYSNALSEARYMGVVPIVNAIPANLELIEHLKNGWVVDPFTPEHLADAILAVTEKLDHYKQAFGPVNRDWILLNAHLQTNVRRFVRDCKKVVQQYRRKKGTGMLAGQ